MFLTDEDIKKFRKGISQRLTFGSQTREYQSYFVPVDYLFFNDMNGRIATFIMKNDYSGDSSVKLSELRKSGKMDEYNSCIAEFVKKSADDGGESFKKTKEDIYKNGQKIPGVILRDGRIIDGNRRFTCLRELLCDTGDNTKFGYFECVILDVPETKQQQKEIKLLELNIQFNEDTKKDYNRIDFLVSFYRDVMDESNPNRLDKKTYCNASGLKEAEFKKDENIVKVMLDYLEFRGTPKAFYILKDEKLDGPIEDIAAKTRKWTSEEWNAKKTTIYSYMTYNRTGDRTRDIRNILKSAATGGCLFRRLDEVVNGKMVNDISDGMSTLDKKPATFEEGKKKEELFNKIQAELTSVYKLGSYQENKMEDEKEPQKILDVVNNDLDKANPLQFENAPLACKTELLNSVREIKRKINELEKALIK